MIGSLNIVIQLAKLSGFSTIIATASLKHTEYLKALGATDVLDRTFPLPNLSQKIVEIAKVPILRVFDAISLPATQELGLSLVAPGGLLALVLKPTLEASEGKTIIWVSGVLRIPENIEILEDLFQTKAAELVGSGAIRVSYHFPPVKVFEQLLKICLKFTPLAPAL
jgi:NADPH:quinone reductase-like Zn-dependent oxidoreductase